MPATAKTIQTKSSGFLEDHKATAKGPRELNGDGQTKGHCFDGVVKQQIHQAQCGAK